MSKDCVVSTVLLRDSLANSYCYHQAPWHRLSVSTLGCLYGHGSQEGDDVELTGQMVLHLLTICYLCDRAAATGHMLPFARSEGTLRKCNAAAGDLSDSPFR